MTITAKLLIPNIPTGNGRIYSPTVIQDAIDRIKGPILLKKFIPVKEVDLDNLSEGQTLGEVTNLTCTENEFTGTCNIADDFIKDVPEIEAKIKSGEWGMRPAGSGILRESADNNLLVEDYIITHLTLTDDPA